MSQRHQMTSRSMPLFKGADGKSNLAPIMASYCLKGMHALEHQVFLHFLSRGLHMCDKFPEVWLYIRGLVLQSEDRSQPVSS